MSADRSEREIHVSLVLEIKKHPCIYNNTIPEYTSKVSLDLAWAKISRTVLLPVNDCKEKWRNIRSSYLRTLKHDGRKTKSPYYLSEYLQFVAPFMKPLQRAEDNDPETSMNTESTEDEDMKCETVYIECIKQDESGNEAEEHNEILTKPLKVKRSKSDKLQKTTKVYRRPNQNYSYRKHLKHKIRKENQELLNASSSLNDANSLFLSSLRPELNSLNEDQQRLFKIKVMMLIHDLKTNSDQSKQNIIHSTSESERLQKRLINLLLANLKRK